jgi:hypothetical protein
MNKLQVIIATIVGIFTIVGGVFGAQQYMETKYARVEMVQRIQQSQDYTNKRLEQKIITDRILSLEERKDRVEAKENKSSDDVERINEYKRDIKELEIHLDQIDKK